MSSFHFSQKMWNHTLQIDEWQCQPNNHEQTISGSYIPVLRETLILLSLGNVKSPYQTYLSARYLLPPSTYHLIHCKAQLTSCCLTLHQHFKKMRYYSTCLDMCIEKFWATTTEYQSQWHSQHAGTPFFATRLGHYCMYRGHPSTVLLEIMWDFASCQSHGDLVMLLLCKNIYNEWML